MNLTDYADGLVLRDGIYFASASPEISYPEDDYDVFYQIEENSFWFKFRNEFITSAINRFSPGKPFFDIGGGNGFVTRAIEKSGIEAALIEPGVSGCFNGRKRGLQNIVCATLQEAGFRHNSLPAAGLFDVVEHIENDEDFLNMIRTYLEQDGFLYVTVPAYQSIWSDEDDQAGHYRRYTTRSISQVLEKAGFKTIYATYAFSFLPMPIWLFRSLPAKLGFTKKDRHQSHKNDHKTGGISGWVVEKILDWEFRQIKKGKAVPVGSSCFVVAQKIKA